MEKAGDEEMKTDSNVGTLDELFVWVPVDAGAVIDGAYDAWFDVEFEYTKDCD